MWGLDAGEDAAACEFTGFADGRKRVKVDEPRLVIQAEGQGAIGTGVAHNRRVVAVIVAESEAVTEFVHKGEGQGFG